MKLSDLRFMIVLIAPLVAALGLWYRPDTVGVHMLVFFLLVALLDAWFPGAHRSPGPVAAGEGTAFYRTVPRLYVPLQLALIALGLAVSAQQTVGVAMMLGASVGFICGALGITLAHELGHSKSKFDRFCGWVLMTSVGYGHFMIEHYRGHHPRAATPEDPASARRGETVYRFWLRTVSGSFVSALALERQRLARRRGTWLKSPLLWSIVGSLALLLLPALAFSHAALSLIAFVVSAWIVSILLLETVNYIEHYGLRRGCDPRGKREPFGVMHAWNADHFVTNTLLINLQRHSDHHMHAWKPYEALEPLPGPQLPTGYAGCILLALVPPLWFALMHPRLDGLAQHD